MAGDRVPVAKHRLRGTSPEPPATSSSGPPSWASHTNQPADRTAELELVARAHLVDEVGRDLAVGEPHDGQGHHPLLRRRGDRVAALSLVAVLGGQAESTCWPARWPASPRRQEQRLRARRLGPYLGELGGPPAGGTGRGRLSRPVALLTPGVAVVVVAVGLPEARLVRVHQHEPTDPLRALPEIQVRDEQARGAAVLGLERRAVELDATHALRPMTSSRGRFVSYRRRRSRARTRPRSATPRGGCPATRRSSSPSCRHASRSGCRCLNVSVASARNSSQVHRAARRSAFDLGGSTRRARVWGGPGRQHGVSVTTCWPGGTRSACSGSTSWRRRKPR